VKDELSGFLLDADELAPVIKALQNALIKRPNPEGEPHFDLQTAPDSCDEYLVASTIFRTFIGKPSPSSRLCLDYLVADFSFE